MSVRAIHPVAAYARASDSAAGGGAHAVEQELVDACHAAGGARACLQLIVDAGGVTTPVLQTRLDLSRLAVRQRHKGRASCHVCVFIRGGQSGTV